MLAVILYEYFAAVVHNVNDCVNSVTDVSGCVQVEAGDRDSGVNGQVTYRIASGDPEGHFTINQLTGTLQLARSPDFESVLLCSSVLCSFT